jgi:NAD(P)-dependent dehydrogenase (short-subunit alcohol dehydrogenase family)
MQHAGDHAREKVVVVTGAGSGIGRACAELFAGLGAWVLGVGRTPATLAETGRAIAAAGGRFLAHPADVGAGEGADSIIAAAESAFGGLDVLVNNAGVGYSLEAVRPGSMAAVHATSADDWREVVRINLDSVYFTCHAAIPALRRRGGGAIVNVASAGGLAGMTNAHAYAAAKAGVVNLTRSMAIAYGHEDIRCNVVAPGLVDTPMAASVLAPEVLRAANPMRRAGTPEEIARGIAFIAFEATFCNGSVLVMDGGGLA